MFSYGTLMNDDMRSRVLGRLTNKNPAFLINYEIVDHSRANYPTIKYKLGEITQGILFIVDRDDVIKIDIYENELYERIKVTINNTNCMAYIEKKRNMMSNNIMRVE